MTATLGHIEPFDVQSDDWSLYTERLSQYFVANGISEDGKKVAVLVTVMGGKAYEVLHDLLAPVVPSKKTYRELVDTMKGYLNPKAKDVADKIASDNEEKMKMKLCDLIEEAYWKYNDYDRDKRDRTYNIRVIMPLVLESFSDKLKKDSRTLHGKWLKDKTKRPTHGAILLRKRPQGSEAQHTECLLVKGYAKDRKNKKKVSWGFPKGKLKDREESEMECAIREVKEETGFDIKEGARDDKFLKANPNGADKDSKLFIIPGVSESTDFTRSSTEITDCEWFEVIFLMECLEKQEARRDGEGDAGETTEEQRPWINTFSEPFLRQLPDYIKEHS